MIQRFLFSKKQNPVLTGVITVTFLFLFIISFITNQTNAQVKIKEKVEIKPGNKFTTSSQAGYQLIFQWFGADIEGLCFIEDCDGTHWSGNYQTGGSATVSATTGANYFQVRLNPLPTRIYNGELVRYILEIFYNGELKVYRDEYIDLLAEEQWAYATYYSATIYSDFDFAFYGDKLCDYAYFDINPKPYFCGVSNIWYPPTDSIKFSITSGGKYVSFYDWNGEEDLPVGDNISVIYSPDRIYNISLKNDVPLDGSSGVNITVKAEAAGIEKTADIYIPAANDYKLETELYPETINSGNQAVIFGHAFNECYASVPGEVTFNAEIVSGGQCGYLYNPATGDTGRVINNINHDDEGYFSIYFNAEGIEPEIQDTVTLRFTSSDTTIAPIEEKLYIKPSFLVVTVTPEVLSPGGTADVKIQYRDYNNGEITDFPPEQEFELGVLEGCVFGDFIVGTGTSQDTGQYFEKVLAPIKFKASKNLSSDSGIVKIKVGIIEEIISGITNKGGNGKSLGSLQKKNEEFKIKYLDKISKLNIPERVKEKLRNGFNKYSRLPNVTSADKCLLNEFKTSTTKKKKVVVKKDSPANTIMLGESKYYQAKYNSMEHKIKIEEIVAGEDGVPQLKTGKDSTWEWLTTDVWGNNPVTIVEGDKLGVYWEKEKSILGTNQNLSQGLIRLVGRYWEENKIYKIKLTAGGIGSLSEISSDTLEVMKPTKISSKKYNKIPTFIKDVDGTEINLDNLIIKFAGKSGILPQIIKAQMNKESSFKTAYRYEPFPDASAVQSDSRYVHNRYKIIDENNLGNPSIPANHIQVTPHNYWGYQGTIWEFFFNHSSTLNTDITVGSKNDIYPQENSAGLVLWYKVPKNKWNEIFTKNFNQEISNGSKEDSAKNTARNEANIWLRDKYAGGIMKTGMAQTRMASSYGILQVTYYRALEKNGYIENDSNYPERLNEVEFNMKFWIDIILDYFRIELNNSLTEYNWKDGYELTMRYTLGRYRGTRTDSYGESIIKDSNNFNVEY